MGAVLAVARTVAVAVVGQVDTAAEEASRATVPLEREGAVVAAGLVALLASILLSFLALVAVRPPRQKRITVVGLELAARPER